MKINVRVPATSANLGPGFDIFGLAINLYNTFSVQEADKLEIILGNNNQKLPINKDNLFYKSFAYIFNKLNKKVPNVKISMDLPIQQGRGFGSSATAVVGGLIAANAFLRNAYSKDDLLHFAIELEQGKHPDNVTPALFGGLTVASMHKSKIAYIKIPFPTDIKAVFFIPDFIMDTITGRKLMPTHYSKQDTIFNASRVALLLAALQTRKYDLLKIAMQDKIHQPTRTKIFPLMPKLIETANASGALGAALSGGGSSIIALADNNFEKIANAMKIVAENNGITGKIGIYNITNDGVKVQKN